MNKIIIHISKYHFMYEFYIQLLYKREVIKEKRRIRPFI